MSFKTWKNHLKKSCSTTLNQSLQIKTIQIPICYTFIQKLIKNCESQKDKASSCQKSQCLSGTQNKIINLLSSAFSLSIIKKYQLTTKWDAKKTLAYLIFLISPRFYQTKVSRPVSGLLHQNLIIPNNSYSYKLKIWDTKTPNYRKPSHQKEPKSKLCQKSYQILTQAWECIWTKSLLPNNSMKRMKKSL